MADLRGDAVTRWLGARQITKWFGGSGQGKWLTDVVTW